MRIYLFWIACWSLAGGVLADDLKDLAQDARASVVKLRILDWSGREIGAGTGFYVTTDGLVVTNRHVIEKARRIEAVPAEGEPLPVRGILAEDPVNDLAVLSVETAESVPLPLAGVGAIDPGERVVVLGGPLGLAGSLSEGIVSAIREPDELEVYGYDAATLLQITAAISPGSSGSPVMTLDGRVVGVAVSQFRVGQNLNFAVPVSAVHALLDGIGPAAGEAPLASVGGASRNAYLRNLVISAAVFAALFVAFKRLR